METNQREIFRGRTIDGKWVKGDLVHLTSSKGEKGCAIITDDSFRDFLKPGTGALCYSETEVSVVEPKTVGQYVGQEDFKNVKIFANDILKTMYDDILLVLWCSAKSSFIVRPVRAMPVYFQYDAISIDPKWISEFKVEVIGNQFDNPELC